MLSEFEFTLALHRSMRDYKRENAWFSNMVTQSTYDYTRRNEDNLAYFIVQAWTIYKNVFEGMVDPIFLGNSEIRQQQDHILSFGILSATQRAQDENINAIIDNVEQERAAIFGGAAAGLQTVPQTTETGAILSSVGWSPMMNDAMIIAGIARRIEFIYILSDDEQAIFARIKRQYDRHVGTVGNSAAIGSYQWNLERQQLAKHIWSDFFENEPDALWRGGIPRMFIREMLGLRHFGYDAILDESQITFSPAHARNATFADYLTCLRNVAFHANDKATILTTISDFLFGEDDLLDNI